MTSNLWMCCLLGLQSSRSNPSIQATLNKTVLSSSLNSRPQASAPNASALHSSLRLFSLSNPSLSTTNLSGPSRRRQPPVSPLTLSPGPEAHQSFSRQLSSTSPLKPYPASQVKANEQRNRLKQLGIGLGPHTEHCLVRSEMRSVLTSVRNQMIQNALMIFQQQICCVDCS